MKIIVAILLTIVVSISMLFALTNKHDRWVYFYGSDAKLHAENMLDSNSSNVSDAFIDYSIFLEDGFVMFNKHGNDIIYVYKSNAAKGNNKPNLEKWKKIDDSWYAIIPK